MQRILFVAVMLVSVAVYSAKGVKKINANNFELSRTEVLRYVGNLDATLAQAKMEPNKVNGKVNGYRFASLDKGSVYESLGFKAEDVVTHINDQEVTSPAVAQSMLPSLILETEFAVKLIRKGKTLTQIYRVAD